MRRLLLTPIALLSAPFLHAQLSDCTTAINATVTAISMAKSSTAADKATPIANALNRAELVAACYKQESEVKILAPTITKDVEAKRTDVQAGAPAAASGTTTAVASASKPNFLGLALENGATTQTTSGTSTTVSINPWKFVDSIGHDLKQHPDPNDEGSKLLRKLALSLTLNSGNSTSSKQTSTMTGAGTATPTTLITQLKQVSNFTAHFDIHNDRDPMSGGAAQKIREKTKVPAGFFKSANRIGGFTIEDASTEANTLLTFPGDLTAEVTRYVNGEIDKIARDAEVVAAVGDFQATALDLIKENKALYSGLAHSPTFSIEYSLDRQPMVQATASGSAATTPPLMNTPDLHTARLIHSYGYYTLNASASFFGQKTAAMPDLWRDLQLGAKVDIPISGVLKAENLGGTLEFSGLFVDLHQMPLGINLMVNGVSVTQPGKIGLFQAKYTFSAPGSSGVQVPISITYSNRTDLVKETSIQGNIGITWDMSKVVAAIQAKPMQ